MTQPTGAAGVKRREFLKVLGAAGAANAVFVNQHETGSFPAFLDRKSVV